MKIGDRVFVHGYIDEIRKGTIIICNKGGYFGTVPSEVIVGKLPSADRPKGKWIYKKPPDDWVLSLHKCDQCGHIEVGKPNFCPNCGADMRGEQDANND